MSLVTMESNPLRGLFGVSSPRPVEQRVAPQPTEPTESENVHFEIPSGMLEKLLANPFVGNGTKHPDEHLIYVDEVCGLFKLAGVGVRSRNLKFSTYHQDQSMESSSNEREGSASTYPCRSRAEAFKRTGLMESYSS